MRSWLGPAALIASTLATLACSGRHELTPEARRLGYCRGRTPALIAAAGEPSEPVAALTEEPLPGSECNAVERSYPLADPSHVAVCSPVEYGTNPPSSGHHYPLFPEYRVYDDAIPRGFWVHSMEHGGVVFTYSCGDCDDEVSQAAALIAATEPAAACCTAAGCASTVTNQLLMTPDPGLSTRWAASSWGFTLTADCFEPAIFRDFANAHRDNGAPEMICDNTYATDVTEPGPD
jgi:hypothetical protein